jgi:hypothetical protein
MFRILALIYLVASAAVSVNAHGLITCVEGANGVTSKGFAVLDNIPRNVFKPANITQVRDLLRG